MGLDSVELIMEVEKHFSISIADADAENATTVGKLVDCVANILAVNSYNFALREKTFLLIKNEFLKINRNLKDFSLNNKVSDTLDIGNKSHILELENKIGLKLPGIYFIQENHFGIWGKVKQWFNLTEAIDFNEISWKKYIDITIAKNIEKIIPPDKYNSKYEIYIAIMKITVDKIGVDYEEIGIEKSFTNDLGVD